MSGTSEGRRRSDRGPTWPAWLWLLAAGCGGEAPAAVADASDAGGGVAVFGAACAKDGDCRAGLRCLKGDWAPEPFCSLPCPTAKAYCAEADTGGVQGLCIALPADFQGTELQFCVPMCQQTADCKALDSMWQICDKPAWKNVKLAPELPTKVCSAPSAQGQIVVDPVECDWESKITDPQLQSGKQICKSYCSFLKTCQFWDTDLSKIECCAWKCFQQLAPKGAIDAAAEADKKCYINAFGAAQGTGKVCHRPYYEEPCGPIER